MIVRRGATGLRLITQPDHARLARRLMERCVSLAAHPRRDTILHAIAEHDSFWAEVDADPTVDPGTGDVVDFVNAPLGVRQAGAPRAIAELADDPWAAALVAQHGLTVYNRFQNDADWASFFSGVEATRAGLLRESGLPLDELVRDYAFLRLGDLISLAFCTGWTDEHRFAGYAVRLSGDRVGVAPDLFGGQEVALEIAARDIPRTTFASDADLRAALAGAAETTLTGSVGAELWTSQPAPP